MQLRSLCLLQGPSSQAWQTAPPRSLMPFTSSIARDVTQKKSHASKLQTISPANRVICLPVLRLDEVTHVLGLLVSVVVVTVAVVVVVVLRTDVLHLVDTAALGASLDRAVAGDLFIVFRLAPISNNTPTIHSSNPPPLPYIP